MDSLPARPRHVSIEAGFTLLMLLLAACVCGNRVASAADDPAREVVEVEGAGVDVESARRDACRQAVRQVVGAYLGDKTVVENDELIEDKVIALSSGFVEKIEPIRERKADGLVRVKIRATVRKTKVIESLKKNKLSVAKVDGLSLDGELDTTNDQRQGAGDLIQAAFEGFPAQWFDVETEGKARLGERKDGESVPLLVTLRIKPDLEAFVASATKLDEALKATKRPHGSFQVDGAKLRRWVKDEAAARQQASDLVRSLLVGDDRAAQQCKSTAIDFFDASHNFPEDLKAFPGTGPASGDVDSGRRVVEWGYIPVVFPVKFFGKGSRSTWHWYGLKTEEAVKYLKPQRTRAVKVCTTLLDDKGGEIAMDEWEIPNLGIGGMHYWDDWQIADRSYIAAVVVAPALVRSRHGDSDFDWIVQQFSCERSFLLRPDEVRTIKQVKSQLE